MRLLKRPSMESVAEDANIPAITGDITSPAETVTETPVEAVAETASNRLLTPTAHPLNVVFAQFRIELLIVYGFCIATWALFRTLFVLNRNKIKKNHVDGDCDSNKRCCRNKCIRRRYRQTRLVHVALQRSWPL